MSKANARYAVDMTRAVYPLKSKSMGLDMYLERDVFIGNTYKKPNERVKIPVKGVKAGKVQTITEQAGYWRKANAIHNWFVKNVQGGDDDCSKRSYVTRDQLKELLDIVQAVLSSTKLVPGEVNNGYSYEKDKTTGKMKEIKHTAPGKVLENPTTAKKLLPTISGFFFGSTDYDEYYWSDLQDTEKILLEALATKEGDFYYTSSW